MQKSRAMSTFQRLGTGVVAATVVTGLAACDTDNDGAGDDNGDNGDDGHAVDLQMGTGSTGGVYFPLGQEYATIFADTIDVDGLDVSAVETGASAENLAKIARGEHQLGISQTNTAADAVNGDGEFDGAELDNIGFMGRLYPEAAQIITLESTGIESVEDLVGKTVSVGPPGGGTREAAEQILSAHGVEEGDYDAIDEGFEDARTKLQDGNADASIEVLGVPAGSLGELAATAGDVKLISMDDSKIADIVDNSQLEEYEIPESTYDFIDEPINTVSVFAAMYGSTDDISDDLGYELTRSMYENVDDLSLDQKDLIDPEEATRGQGDVPLHPGAERYFEEEGLLD